MTERAGAPRQRRLEGRTAIVTGASRGIGLAVAQRLVGEGARVVITARKPEPLAEAVEALGGPEHALGVPGKADDADHQSETIEAAVATFGGLDLLVNNTGINPGYGDPMEIGLAAARKTFETNVVATLGWVQEAHRAWMAERRGAVVNVASMMGRRPTAKAGAYGASKAALIHLTRQLAAELGLTIRVNAVAPAVVTTRLASVLYEGREEEAASRYPLRRLGVPEDVAGAVAFLLSDDAAWITGETLTVDGGLSATGGIGH